jgi:hypothetical protein
METNTDRVAYLLEAEEKAYARREETEKAIELLIGEELMKNSFFILRQLFSEWEDSERRCSIATDRVSEVRVWH